MALILLQIITLLTNFLAYADTEKDILTLVETTFTIYRNLKTISSIMLMSWLINGVFFLEADSRLWIVCSEISSKFSNT